MPQQVRCAIYCRKSVMKEADMQQEFNSIDAQRGACEAYIMSKRYEGWECLPTHYDDGGFSGGTLKRPAFQKLMDDVRAHKVDAIVCYKIDRLSRSLLDFAQIFSELEKHNVTFACVTQDLNTSTPMGRMCTNILMTFAQFEREVTSERVTDKMEATRRKGLWPGGSVPYGYKRENKRLIPNPDEAPNLVKIFEWFVELGSPKLVVKKLQENHILRGPGKEWNTEIVGTALRNVVYIGRVPLREESFPGVHERLICDELWEKAQALLKKRAAEKITPSMTLDSPALLTGLVKCGHCGDALSYTWSGKRKNGKIRYGYYTCRKDMRRGVSTCPVRSVPAQLIEPVVEAQVITFLRTPTMMMDSATKLHCSPFDVQKRLANPDDFWNSMTPKAKRDLIADVVESITVYESSIDIKFKLNGNKRLMEELKNEYHGD